MQPKSFITSYWPGIALFVIFVIIGLAGYKQYGMGWDEPIQRGMGRVSYNYVFNGDKALLDFDERSHGVGFELPLIIIEQQLHLTDPRDIYLMRHLATHLFFLFSAFFGYLLCLRLFKDQWLACLGYLLLVLHPRIYAHSFLNSKDVPFLSALIIVLALAEIAFSKRKAAWYLLLAMACGYATSIRAMGILFPACISLFFVTDIISAAIKKGNARKCIGDFVLFVIVFCGSLCAAWPILWTRPLFHFQEEFAALSHIYWHGFVLFNGVTVAGEQLPWYYVPVWFSITMPVMWLVCGLAGLAWLVITFIKKPLSFLRNTPQRNFLLYAMLFAIPVVMVIALRSILYDDWRHLYFIYPPFVLLVLFAIHKLPAGIKQYAAITLCGIQLVITSVFMLQNHPFENVYFNQLVPHKPEYLRTHYDMDYWGSADKQALEYILAHYQADTIRVWRSMDPVANNSAMLPATTRNRIKLVDSAGHPAYFITNFRNHPEDYPYPHIFYEIKLLNSTMLRVYKLP